MAAARARTKALEVRDLGDWEEAQDTLREMVARADMKQRSYSTERSRRETLDRFRRE